jgi:uncharacterized protein (DUF1330 family)
MKAYFIIYEIPRDPEKLHSLAPQLAPTLAAHRGRFIVRGGVFTTLEGEMPFQRIAVLQFLSRRAAESWYHSPEYQRIVAVRSQWAEYQVVLVDGVEDDAVG